MLENKAEKFEVETLQEGILTGMSDQINRIRGDMSKIENCIGSKNNTITSLQSEI